VPALAFAGSAALLLVMLWPANEDSPDTLATPATVAQADQENGVATPSATAPDTSKDGRLADAMLSKEEPQDPLGLGGDFQRGQGLAIGEREPEPVAEEEVALPPASVRKPTRARASGGSANKKSVAPGKGASLPSAPKGGGALPTEQPEPLDYGDDDEVEGKKDKGGDLWVEIFEGDQQRRAGNCGLAKMRYDKAHKSDDDKVRARALAGKGLCETLAGREGPAGKLFKQARAADPGVGGFIDAELTNLEQASEADDAPDLAQEELAKD